jgi:D-alanine--poly(phosphoribitol) ligase subunit 1
MVALPQGVDAYAAMLAVGLAGGYYVPVNISAPAEKLRLIIRVASPDLILVDDAPSEMLLNVIREEVPGAAVLNTGSLREAAPFKGSGKRHEIAYIMFTSGSTGIPKGVVIPRSALNHYITWATDALDLGQDDRVSQHPNIGFDVSVLEIYGALCSGATLCPVVESSDRLMPARFIFDLNITVWVSVPSVVSLMMYAKQVRASRLRSVRLFLFCGEPLLRQHLDAIFNARPDTTVLNTYGPTESTVSVTCLSLRANSYAAACASSVALGNPISGVGLHLVGGRHPDEGEIVLTGKQLALGYWNDAERTAEKFRSIDVSGLPVRGYFTGDWAERQGGLLFFRERIDFQIKLHGYRIELDEVAAAIRTCGWPMVCVFRHGDSLVAVVEAQDGVRFDAASLRAEVAKRIESYAVPAEIRAMPRMPRNVNDKLDRDAVASWFEKQSTVIDSRRG